MELNVSYFQIPRIKNREKLKGWLRLKGRVTNRDGLISVFVI